MIELTLLLFLFFCSSFILSTVLIRWGIRKLKREMDGEKGLPESSDKPIIFDLKSTGFWIGLCETLLVFVFVLEKQYGALAIIIGAKQFVRKDKIQEDPSYFLLGTLINLVLALLFALIARTSILE